jgi:two-component system, NtrC family, nitrogen regulation response regulator GlnG
VTKVLVIDDDESVRYSFQRVFSADDVTVVTAKTADEGLCRARELDPDVVVLDLQLPDRSGLDVFADLRRQAPKLPVIFITAHGTTQTAIEAMKNGAFDYLIKPVDLDRLSQILQRAIAAARLMRVPAVLPDSEPSDQIIGRSPIMQEMCKAIGRIAPQEVNVLIVGESGSGKELVARALWRHSPRSDKPFLAINCAAIPEALLESELFGHEKGAFTGADRQRIGKFEQCSGGTLLLDEIGDMPLSIQAKMLRVLQEQRFERVGGNEPIQTHVRVLAATNQDLVQLTAAGKFRKDLYYRLNDVTIRVPPLRDRPEDLAELANYFLFRYDRELGMDLRALAPETLDRLQAYDWPGNVRELQGVVKQSMLNASGHVVLPEFLPAHLEGVSPESASPAKSDALDLPELIESLLPRASGRVHAEVMAAVERRLFKQVLRHTHGHQAQASEILGLNRSTLRHRLKTLGLSVDKGPMDTAENPPSR